MFHLALGHFPIAFLTTGALWLLVSLVTDSRSGTNAAIFLLLMGAGASIPTVTMGLWIEGDHEAHLAEVLAIHRMLGIATMVVALLATLLHWMSTRVLNADVARNLLFLMAGILAGGTGFVGGEMMHGEPGFVTKHATVHAGGHTSTVDRPVHAH